jgi:hypothetical protein
MEDRDLTPRRRLAVVALVALGLLLLAGPDPGRSEPSVAASVNDVEITEAELDRLMVDADRLAEGLAADRTEVVAILVVTEAVTPYLRQQGVPMPEPAVETIASDLQLVVDSPYVQMVGKFFAAISAVQNAIAPVPPSEADQRELYDNLVSQGLTTPFAEIQVVLTVDAVGEWVAMRDQIAAAVAAADIEVNPRYQPEHRVMVPLGDAQSWLSVPLS